MPIEVRTAKINDHFWNIVVSSKTDAVAKFISLGFSVSLATARLK